MLNRPFLRAGAAFAVGIVALTAYAAVQDLNLKFKPKVGDVSKYSVSATFQTPMGDVTFAQKRTETIAEVKPDGGYVAKATTSETQVTFGGQELPAQPEVSSTVEIGADGRVKSISSDGPATSEASSVRLANLHAFEAPSTPAKIGDEIKYEIPADSKKGTPGVKAAYKVVGVEKVKDWDCVKLTFTSSETEGDPKAMVTGTLWLSTVDGAVIKSQEEWKDVQPAGAPFPVSGTFANERIK